MITLESSFWGMNSFDQLLPQINNYSAYGVEKGEAMKESEQEMIKLAKSNFSLFENLESFMMSTNDSGHIPTILIILPPTIIYFRFVPSSSTGQLGLTHLAKRLAEIKNLPLLKRMYDSKQRSYYGAKKEIKIAKIGEITLGGKVIELETIAY